jgi:hypothetical protein
MSPQLSLALPAGLIAGVLLGGLYLLIARRSRCEMLLLALGLIVAAAAYLVFAITGSSSIRELRLEIAGFVLFTPIALAGVRWWPILLGIGWLAHAGWDFLIHWPAQPWVPALYPVFCGSFDLVVAAYFLFLFAMRKAV